MDVVKVARALMRCASLFFNVVISDKLVCISISAFVSRVAKASVLTAAMSFAS